ncbi:hypothetical protein [Streptomyces abikoensis]
MSGTEQGTVLGVLVATVHVLHPVDRVPLILTVGTEVTDPAVAEQITNPGCWEGGQQPAESSSSRSAKKPSKSAD